MIHSTSSYTSLPSFETLSQAVNTNMLVDSNNNSSNLLNLNNSSGLQKSDQINLESSSIISKPLKLISSLKSFLTPATSSSSISNNQNRLNDSPSPCNSPTNTSNSNIFFLPNTSNNFNNQTSNNFYNFCNVSHGPTTIIRPHKFEYNPNVLYDNLQNIIEKNFSNYTSETNLNLSQSSNNLNININNLEELAKIKLEDIDELNGSNPSSNNNSSSSLSSMFLKKSDSLKDQESETMPTTAGSQGSSRSRSSSIANMIFNFCKGKIIFIFKFFF